MTARFAGPKRKQRCRDLCVWAWGVLAALIAAGDRAAARSARSERSVESIESRTAGRAGHGHRFAAKTSGSSSTTPTAGSCGRRCRAARRDARRPPASSASSRRMRSTTRTCMTMPTCPTCSASPGRASRFTAAPCRDIRRRMAASGCPSISPTAVRRDPAGHAGDRGARRCGARRDRPSCPVSVEAGRRRSGRRPRRGGGRGGQEGGSGEDSPP